MPSDTANGSRLETSLWAGRIISTLVVLFLLFDAVAKLMRIAPVLAAFTQLGFSTSLAVPSAPSCSSARSSTRFHLPRSSAPSCWQPILAAQLLPPARRSTFLLPNHFGVLLWGGLYLRETPPPLAHPLRSPQALLVSLF